MTLIIIDKYICFVGLSFSCITLYNFAKIVPYLSIVKLGSYTRRGSHICWVVQQNEWNKCMGPFKCRVPKLLNLININTLWTFSLFLIALLMCNYGKMQKKISPRLVCRSHCACLDCMLPGVQVLLGWQFFLRSSHLCDNEDCDFLLEQA